MEDENVISLKAEIEELSKLSSMKDEEIEKLKNKVKELEAQIIELTKSGYEDMDNFIISQFHILSGERENAEKENELLKTKLLKAIAKKHQLNNTIQALKLKCVPYSPKSPSGFEAENQKLNIKVSNLESDLDFTQDQLNAANEEIQKYKDELDELKKNKEKWLDDATEHFNVLKAKLDQEREKMKSDNLGQVQLQNESLLEEINQLKEKSQNDQEEFQNQLESLKNQKEQVELENNSFKEQIKSLNDQRDSILNAQTEFLESLNQLVGCQTLEDALVKVRGLVLLPEKCQKLQEKIDSLKSCEVVQSHDVVIDALTEINEKLSPNNLNLPHDSVLRHLFASLCNMLSDALDPKITKNKLDTHILSVVYQARSFIPSTNLGKGTEGTDQLLSKTNPSFYQVPDVKKPL